MKYLLKDKFRVHLNEIDKTFTFFSVRPCFFTERNTIFSQSFYSSSLIKEEDFRSFSIKSPI